MKETIQDLKTRRSVKKYRSMNAPSGMGRQSAVMAVVQDPETLKKLSSLNASIMGVSSDPFYGAPTVIVVLADSTVPTYREDGSLVMGNLLNAAHALGLGSCWIHRAKEVMATPEGQELLKKWGLDSRYVGIGNCILGYGDGPEPQAKPRKENYIIWD